MGLNRTCLYWCIVINQELAQGFALQMPYFENKNFTCACISLFSVFLSLGIFLRSGRCHATRSSRPLLPSHSNSTRSSIQSFSHNWQGENIYIYIYILFKGSWGVLFHLCLVFEIFRSYSCSPATLPNRASAGSLFTLIFLIWSAGVSLLRRINRGKYIKQRTLFISRCTNRQVQRQTITEETAIRSTTFTGKFVYADFKKNMF